MRRMVISLLLVASSLRAQQRSGASIDGIVRDSLARPIADVTVTLKPTDRTTKTDSLGAFRFDDLGADNYSVRARKLGYRPESWDVKLSKAGHAEVKFELAAVPRFLDTVRVNADGSCPTTRSIESFLCRRQRPGGVFLDYTDIDDTGVGYVAELFRDIRGFRVDFRVNDMGPAFTVRHERGSGCITSLVDGREVTPANPIPRSTGNLRIGYLSLHFGSRAAVFTIVPSALRTAIA